MKDNAILQQVAELPKLSTIELRKLWQELYKSPPPLYNKASLLNRLAYRIQELHFGGLATATRKQLQQMAKGQKVTRRPLPDDRPVTGTRLVREFNGKTHTVTVRTHGFEYDGRLYKSLTPIACRITGTRWSGPAFFGLKRTKVKK